MTQPSLNFTPAKPPTLTEQLVAFFQANPGVKVPMQTLAQHFGTGGWRTRVSDARLKHGLDIRNEYWTATRADGTKRRVSVYWLHVSEQKASAA